MKLSKLEKQLKEAKKEVKRLTEALIDKEHCVCTNNINNNPC